MLSTTVAGTITQGNLYGDQSVVVASPISVPGNPTLIQVIDTGDLGMGKQSIRTFVPFAGYRGPLALAVGDFLQQGYQQLIVSTTGQAQARVSVFDLFRTFAADPAAATTGVFSAPVRLQSFTPFPGFSGPAFVAAGDFDADGKDDLAVGAGLGGGSRINVYAQGTPGGDGLLPAPQRVNSFRAFGSAFKGGVTLAAGHLTGAPNADLVVGAGAGGGSRVVVFTGASLSSRSAPPRPTLAYLAFGSGRRRVDAPVQVVLVESIVAPDAAPVTELDAHGRTALFTPSNSQPLALGTIVAYNPQVNAAGVVSVCSLVSGTPRTSQVQLPSISANAAEKVRLAIAPVGYLFNHAVDDPLAPTVLAADEATSSVSLLSLTGTRATAVPNIFPGDATAAANPAYHADSFPFGLGIGNQLAAAVKLLTSGVATHVSGGTSGMLPSRQVAYRSPFSLHFTTDAATLFARYGSGFFTVPGNQSSLPLADWYDSRAAVDSSNWYGPDLAVFGQNANFSAITASDPTVWRESMVAAGLQFMNRGYSYQHHHVPAWFGTPAADPVALGAILSTYDNYSLTPDGMQTPGLDCSDFSALVTNMVTGEKIKEGIAEQATVVAGRTQWGTLEGTSDIFINNDSSQGILSWYTLALYYQRHGAIETYRMLSATLLPGDLLFYGSIPAGTLDPHRSLDIDTAAHVTIWTGQTLPIPGRSDVGVPLIMDSHGGNIQVGVDADNRPVGVIEPAGPQFRPWFVPAIDTLSDTTTPLAELLPAATLADQNYYYFTSFTHAVRIDFPTGN